MYILNLLRDQAIETLPMADIDCSGCVGNCCSQPWDVEITSTEAEILGYDISKHLMTGRFFLNRDEDGKCLHQTTDGRCGIYLSRPKVCRSYDCREDSRIIPEGKFESTK